MKKFLMLYYLFLACVCTTQAQIFYTKQDSVNNNFYSVNEAIGKPGYLITSVNFTSSPNGNFKTNTKLLHINNNGLLIDSLEVDTNFSTYGKLTIADSCYYVYGVKYNGTNTNSVTSTPTLLKYDSNFNLVKAVKFNNYIGMTVGVNQTTVKKNNFIYLFFAYNHTIIKCYKLTKNLTKVDSATFNGLFIYDAVNYGNNILVSGTNFDHPSPQGRLQVHELDTTFNLVSFFNFDNITTLTVGNTPLACTATIGISPTKGSLVALSANKYLVSGYFPVIYNSNCQKDDQQTIAIVKNNQQIIAAKIEGKQNGINETSTTWATISSKYNNIYSVSKSNSPQIPISPQNVETEIMVNKIDTSGNIIWNNYYGTTDYYYDPYAITATSDSGAIVCGVRYNISNPAISGVCEGFVMKLDKNGNILAAGIKNHNRVSYSSLICYPNPSTESIAVDLPFADYYELNIHDIYGRLVHSDNKYKNSSKCSIEQILPGTYFVSAIYDGKVYRTKFIKQ